MNKTKTNRNVKIAAVVLMAILAALIVAIISVVVYIVTYKPPVSGGEIPFETLDSSKQSGNESEGVDNPGGIKNEQNYNMLLVGHDRAALLADVIMLANYNVKDGKVTIMQIPRDTVIDGGAHKINTLYLIKYNDACVRGESNPSKTALEDFTNVIEKNFCVKINYSALVDLDAFVNIVDLIGGVEMNVPCDMEYVDPYQNLTISIKAGLQTLDGKTAEGVVRFRSDYVQADIGRTNAQKIFMASFFKKIKSSLSLQTVTGIAEQVFTHVVTDMRVEDVAYFAKNALSLDFSNILMLTAPGDGYGAGDYVLNRGAIIELVNARFNLFENDISEEVFDLNSTLCNMNDPGMREKYYAPHSAIDYEFTMEDALSGEITIPTN